MAAEDSAVAALGRLLSRANYKVSMSQISGGSDNDSSRARCNSTSVAMDVQPLSPAERAAKEAFQKKAAKLQAAVTAALEIATNNETELATIKRALTAMPYPDGAALLKTTEELKKRNNKILMDLRGDNFARTHEEQVRLPFRNASAEWCKEPAQIPRKPTKTMEDDYKYAAQALLQCWQSLACWWKWIC